MIKLFTGILLIAAFGMQSCSTYKHIAYFQDVPDSARVTIKNAKYNNLIIQPGDQLYINIQTMDPAANAIFNQNVVSSGLPTMTSTDVTENANSLSSSPSSYFVDSKGEIYLPMLGVLYVGGLTTEQAKAVVEEKASIFYKNPSINVRFANLKVTVLGEVNHPGAYLFTGEKNTIYDALALAGDLSIFGKRYNILLVRDSAGSTQMIRFSLNSKDLVKQDFFYLKQNDMIYVEPEKAKIAVLNVDKSRNFAIAASLISLLIVIATRVK